MGLDHRRLLPAYLLGAYTVVVAAFASLPMIETAAVKVTIPAQRLDADVTMNGVLDVTSIAASVSESQQGTSSTLSVPPTRATGSVTFSCSPACTKTIHMPAHQLVATTQGWNYQTDKAVDVVPGAAPPAVAVTSVDPGPGGNTSANTVTVIVGFGALPSPAPSTSQLHVTNPQPITGGTAATTTSIVEQSDLDAVQAELTATVNQDLGTALRAKAAGLMVLPIGPPHLDVTSDHNAGDRTPKFTITISGSLNAIAFADSSAEALLKSALQKKVPAGYALTAAPLQWTYLVVPVGGEGNATLSGTISGFVAPKLSATTLSGQLAGATVQEARARLQREAPGSQVEIHANPAGSPWLPLLPNHIDLTLIVVQPAA
jgi:baseplate J-like protein